MATSPTLPLPSLDMLTSVQHLHEIENLEPARFIVALEADLGTGNETLATLGAQLDGLHQALLAIEQLTRLAMGVRLTHVLAKEPVPPQLRRLLSATVVSYADDLTLLRQRFDRYLSPALLDAIIEAAQWVLALRQALYDSVLELGRRVALAQESWLQNAARNRMLENAERLRLRLARLDLQQLVELPERLAAERFEARLKKLPVPEEECEVEAGEDTKAQRFSLLEID